MSLWAGGRRIREDPPCGIEGHTAWTMASRKFWRWHWAWRLTCMRCLQKKKGILPPHDEQE